MEKNIQELNKRYNLEFEKIISEIKKSKAKLILLQFPEGLNPYATIVVDYLKEKTNAEFLIWAGSCYGACDTPTGIEKLNPKIDLVVQFGHNEMMPAYS
jgi:2-(3-amino-3-carboxypropyl)histidine synthase